jgi:hypothetical protein
MTFSTEPEESWRTVIGGEGRYEVSSLGRVKDNNSRGKGVVRMLALTPDGSGYLQVRLCLQNDPKGRLYLVHRVVAFAFHPNPLTLPVVNHKNGIKMDNAADNLEWVSHSENANHAVVTGLRDYTAYVRLYPKQRVIQYALDGTRLQEFSSIQGACRALKIPTVCIHKVCTGKRRQAGGYQWRFWRENSLDTIPAYVQRQKRRVPAHLLAAPAPVASTLPAYEEPGF